MKLICYILLILLIPAIPVGAQTLSGGQVQVSNQSILISDNGQVMIGMDITLPAAMELSSNCVATLTPVLKTQDNSYNSRHKNVPYNGSLSNHRKEKTANQYR